MNMNIRETRKDHLTWPLILMGQGLFVFAVVALSGPGRIDIVDAQTRFEVGRNLLEHGDSALRDPRVWFGVFPGRDHLNFTTYRLPQSLAAVGAIVLADGTGPVREGRRHFFFVLTSALAAALLSVCFTLGFRALGWQPRTALLWGLAGIFCTPNWYYGTSSFDDILGSLAVVAACVTGLITRELRSILGAVVAGLMMGCVFNCKQPLAAFLFVVLAFHDNSATSRRQRMSRAGIIGAGLLLGIAVQVIYDRSKFPFDKEVVHAEILAQYAPVYAFRPITAISCFAISPGCGIFWYCPPVILAMCGVYQLWVHGRRPLAAAIILSSILFIGFHCCISFFKGDISWGPRYLTPWFAMLWLFAPLGAKYLARGLVLLLLALGFLVQFLALTADPHRLYVERQAPSSFGAVKPTLYFHPAISHLFQRPREIVEMLQDRGLPPVYSPAPSPTFAFPLIDPPYLPESGRPAVERYAVLRQFRPWWYAQWTLSEEDRPVDLTQMIVGLLVIATIGLAFIVLGWRKKSMFVEGGSS